MEHKNLFYYETLSELETAYPDGIVDDVIPGVAYAHDEKSVLFNRKKTNYSIEVSFEDRSGNTLEQSETVLTPDVLDGNSVNVNIYAKEIADYKPVSNVVKITVTGDSAYTVVYNARVDYIVTVHHVFSGEPITADTTVIAPAYEGETVSVLIEPVDVQGYTADPVRIRISGNTEYTLEYEESSIPNLIDLGLLSGTKWASWNVGATAPEEYGNYYAWGETETKSTYTWDTYAYYESQPEEEKGGGSVLRAGNPTLLGAGTTSPDDNGMIKYNDYDGMVTLLAEDDVVNLTYGGDWHIPSPKQFYELINNTTSAWTSINGVSGVQFTSTANGNSIFFPAANGRDDAPSEDIIPANSFAMTWSNVRSSGGIDPKANTRSINSSNTAYCIFGRELFVDLKNVGRYIGLPVRGVVGNDPLTPGPDLPIVNY